MGKLRDQIIWCMVGACDDTCKYYRDNACENNELVKEVEEKLKLWQHYEDMEEAGRLIELPCAVGDTVWIIRGKKVYEATVFRIMSCNNAVSDAFTNLDVAYEHLDLFYNDGRIEKSTALCRYLNDAFLTKEEAEAKLKELKE